MCDLPIEKQSCSKKSRPLGESENISIYGSYSFYTCSGTVELNHMHTFKPELWFFAFIQSIGHLVTVDQKLIQTKTCDWLFTAYFRPQITSGNEIDYALHRWINVFLSRNQNITSLYWLQYISFNISSKNLTIHHNNVAGWWFSLFSSPKHA